MKNWKTIIIIVLVFTVAYAAFVFYQKQSLKDAGMEMVYQPMEITFKVESVENNVGEYIVVGAPVVDHENGLHFGVVKEFHLVPHQEALVNNGESIIVNYPNKSDLWITVNAEATDLNNSYVVAAKKLGIGKKIALYSKGYAFYGATMRIEESDYE
ncbi:MAG: DUF4330 family protein [Bacillota bacterium]|nr:DUF4330 family protein [Bacillota bacterium]